MKNCFSPTLLKLPCLSLAALLYCSFVQAQTAMTPEQQARFEEQCRKGEGDEAYTRRVAIIERFRNSGEPNKLRLADEQTTKLPEVLAGCVYRLELLAKANASNEIANAYEAKANADRAEAKASIERTKALEEETKALKEETNAINASNLKLEKALKLMQEYSSGNKLTLARIQEIVADLRILAKDIGEPKNKDIVAAIAVMERKAESAPRK